MRLRIASRRAGSGLRIACHSEANRRSRADCVPARRERIACHGEAAAFMDCGGKSCEALRSLSEGGAKQDDDTALARPMAYKSKAASRPPQSIWWLTLILAAGLLPPSAFAQAQSAETQPTTSPASVSQPALPQVPITFARSGQEVTVWMRAPKGPIVKRVVLRAFGRAWTAPVAAALTGTFPGYTARIEAPAVRVPTVFSATPADSPDIELGQLVTYPDRKVEWDKNITLYSCEVPEWFRQWVAATGLPVKEISNDLASAKLAPADDKGKSLLILGPPAAGKDLSDVAKLAKDKKVNILIFYADWIGGVSLGPTWFGDVAGAVSVAPTQMLGGLAEIAKQHWPQPLKFSSRRKCWPGIANRWAWIADGNGLPLVEEIRRESKDCRGHLPVLLSYLPWEAQLGRAESADSALLKMIAAAAGMEHLPLEKSIGVLWPDVERQPMEKSLAWAKIRPVLGNAPLTLTYRAWTTVFVLDLMGDSAPTPDDVKALKAKGRWEQTPLVILGDDKMLDEWEWLKLDRAKKTINRPGVVWLSDDELPPSKDNQIRLMLKLTELGVPLAPPSQQEEKKQ